MMLNKIIENVEESLGYIINNKGGSIGSAPSCQISVRESDIDAIHAKIFE